MISLKNSNIVSKFILWFLIISLSPLALATLISYNSSRKALKAEVSSRLVTIADSKANQLEAYARRLKKDGATISYLPEIIDAVEKFTGAFQGQGIESLEYEAIVSEYRPILAYYQQSFGYDDIIIVNPDGNEVFSMRGVDSSNSLYVLALEKESELANVFIKAKTSQETEISNFEYIAQDKKAALFIATPVFRSSGMLGMVIMRIGNQGILEFVNDYTGLGKSGETIAALKKSDEAVFVSSCRFDPKAEFQRRVKFGQREGLDIQKAVGQNQGSGILTDYRNHEVLGVWRYLPTLRLGMVVKMDTQEIFASANKLRKRLMVVSLLLFFTVVAAAILVAYSISTPIKELTQVSSVISAGDLSARARVYADDEIGLLARSFNQMTESLLEAKAKVEQKKAELEEQKGLLEQANKELDNFVYTVSHDLRAPLRGIDGFANFILQDYGQKLESQGRDYLGRIRSAAGRMQTLIDDLLTLSRISRIKNPYEDVAMQELVASAVSRLEFDIKTHKVAITIADALPVVRCDPIKMAEVFLNLISNAIKFSSKNKNLRPSVDIGYSDKDPMHEFYVKDNGIGIDKKYHQEIFGIFKRLHTQEEYEGSGAGLSIVKRVIDDHKGSIWIESSLGQGATFYFTIPKVAPEENSEEQERK